MAHPILFIGLALFGAAAVGSSPRKNAVSVPSGGKVSVNKWGLVGCDPFHTPSGSNAPSKQGIATHPDYQWCYVVQAGDSAGSITDMFFGPEEGWRYVELLAANPHKLTKGTTVSPDAEPTSELNFADMVVGERLYLPRTWNAQIDQIGTPRMRYSAGDA